MFAQFAKMLNFEQCLGCKCLKKMSHLVFIFKIQAKLKGGNKKRKKRNWLLFCDIFKYHDSFVYVAGSGPWN